MQLMRACVISLCISTVVLAGCESAPPPPNDQNEQPGPVVAPGRTAPATSRAPEDSAVPLESNAVIADPEPIPGVTRVEAGPIEVPEELYQRSFEEVQAVIAVLNQIMDRRDYETWKTHLTNHYKLGCLFKIIGFWPGVNHSASITFLILHMETELHSFP